MPVAWSDDGDGPSMVAGGCGIAVPLLKYPLPRRVTIVLELSTAFARTFHVCVRFVVSALDSAVFHIESPVPSVSLASREMNP